MADFLVLEEDGTSHLELEESTSDFLLEDGTFVHVVAGFALAGLAASGGSPAAPVTPSLGQWKAGGFAFPTSTGNHAITGVGFEPQGVLFIYSNQATEDTVVTGTNLGAGIGMASVDWDSASVVQYAMCILPNAGQEHRPSCIVMETNGTTTDFRADMVSFDADGFTINVTNAASAARPVHWLAWGGFDNAGAHKMLAGTQTLALGWQARALLALGNRTSSGDNRTTAATGWNYLNMGGARYPISTAFWQGAWVSTIAAPSGQRNNDLATWAVSPIRVGVQGHATGPFLVLANNLAEPTGTGNTSLRLTSAIEDYNMFSFWDGEADNGLFTPNGTEDGTTTVTFGNPAMNGAPVAVITLGLSNRARGSAPSGADVACQFGFATEDYQACVVTDADGSFFQSGQRSFVSSVNAGGVNAGTIEFISGGFRTTTEQDDVSPSLMAYLAFGPPAVTVVWIPQSYRRRNKP